MPILLIILLFILTEIALFVLVGGRIGLWPVLALTLLSMLVGLGVLRMQGARSAALARGGLRNVSPGSFLAQGAFAVLAGLLLLAPGFLTDAVGLVLLMPPLQRLLMRALAARLEPRRDDGTGADAEIIEGSFRAEDETASEEAHHNRPRRRLDAPHPPRGTGPHGPHRGH